MKDSWKDAVEAFVENAHKRNLPPVWEDLEYLAESLEKYQPEHIVEYGSGCSTALFFAYAAEKGGVVVTALEDNPHFFYAAMYALSGNYPVNLSPPMMSGGRSTFNLVFSTIADDGPYGMRFTYTPYFVGEFVYVDGPALIGKRRYITNVCEFANAPEVIIVDGRPSQVSYINSIWGGHYTLDIDKEHNRATFISKYPKAIISLWEDVDMYPDMGKHFASAEETGQ